MEKLGSTVRFGVFDADFRTQELRKQGVRVKLPQQSFQILQMLLEQPGELVTRDQLRQALWPGDTFVDFDHGVNNSIKRIRDALGDSAESPRYIETLPRLGYRFVAPVETQNLADLDSARVTVSAKAGAAKASGPRWKLILPAAVAVLALSVTGYFYFHRPPKLTGKDTIVLAEFTNTTGDTVFDGTLRQGLSVQLDQSPFLSLVSEKKVQQNLQMMGQKPDAKLTPEIARELCQRTASAAVLDGSIAQIGTQYLLTLKAVNCSSGELLASTEAQASDKNHVLDALGKTASEIRNKLGESLSTVQRFDTPLEQATTPSLEALQAYSLGTDKGLEGGTVAGLPFFKRAIELDPNFAMAYVGLGYVYSGLGEPSLAVENFKKAYDFRGRVSEREKLVIESAYYWIAIGDLEKARQTDEVLEQTYPRDAWSPNDLSIIYHQKGEHAKALAEAQEAARRDPTSGRFYATLAYAYLNLNRLDEAQATAEEGQAKKLDSPYLRFALYHVAFLQNNAAGMAKQVAWSVGKPGVEDVLLLFEADTAAYAGRLGKAREHSGRAVASETGGREGNSRGLPSRSSPAGSLLRQCRRCPAAGRGGPRAFDGQGSAI